ncbi:hypothetical protein V5O48_012327 [Marasmius crinis-equi]|uniref:AB hydrolase-1 domain-containing protein n=1 Tax=Marasmius crinis-equi TaxID=585013 RepID=A0ABR3F3G1_9AGAR
MTDANSSELPTIFDPSTCTRKGLCPVTTIRKQGENPLESHSLYYEIHGTGPEKIVLIMGSSFSWFPQVGHFARVPDYSVLVFDNRGVGNSGTPKGPYTTSGMAEDVICLLDYLDWKGDHNVHVVGLSLGGMIAQELAMRIPERIVSLTLGVTTRGGRPWSNLPPWKGVSNLAKYTIPAYPQSLLVWLTSLAARARLTFTKELQDKIPLLFDMLYPTSWIDELAEDDPEGRTNREIQEIASSPLIKQLLLAHSY